MKEVQKMKKSNLITGILYVLFGVVCLIVALLIETKLEGILWGFGGFHCTTLMIFTVSNNNNSTSYPFLWSETTSC